MGGEIAQTIADAGIPVVLKEVKDEFVQQGFDDARSRTELELELGLEAVPERSEIKQAVFEELDSVTPGRAILASANPMLFCAGADIKAFTTMDEAAGTTLLDQMHELLRGLEGEVRIAAQSASFGQPGVNLGIIRRFGRTQRLARLVGDATALELKLEDGLRDEKQAFLRVFGSEDVGEGISAFLQKRTPRFGGR